MALDHQGGAESRHAERRGDVPDRLEQERRTPGIQVSPERFLITAAR